MERTTSSRRGRRRAFTMASWIVLAVLVAASQPTQAADLQDVDVWAATQAFAVVETWNVSITPANTVPPGGWVRVVFPDGFLTSSDGPTECEFTAPATVAKGTTFIVSDTEVLCMIEGDKFLPANVRASINITAMRNPTEIGTVGPFLVSTYTSDGRQIDSDRSVSVQILPDLRHLAGLTATSPAGGTGAVEDWTFRFMPQRNISANASFRVVFPEGFAGQQSETPCTVRSPGGSRDTVMRESDGRRVSCHLGPLTLEGNRTVTIDVPDVRNPTTARIAGPFDVSLRDSEGRILGVHDTLRRPIIPHAFADGPTHRTTNSTVLAEATHTFNLTLFNPVAADGAFRIMFPSNYRLDLDAHTDVEAVAGIDGGFRVALGASWTTLLIERDGSGTAAPNGTRVNITVAGVANPARPGATEPFLVESLNATGGVHDAGTVSAPPILADQGLPIPSDDFGDAPFGLGNNTTVLPDPDGAFGDPNGTARYRTTPAAGILAAASALVLGLAIARRRHA